MTQAKFIVASMSMPHTTIALYLIWSVSVLVHTFPSLVHTFPYFVLPTINIRFISISPPTNITQKHIKHIPKYPTNISNKHSRPNTTTISTNFDHCPTMNTSSQTPQLHYKHHNYTTKTRTTN